MQFKRASLLAAVATQSTAQSVPNITAALASTDSLSTLNTVLGSYPDLVATLANATNITILAPSNSAFERVTDVITALNQTDAGAIPAILMYHVLNGTVYSQNISTTPVFGKSLLTNTTYTNVTGGQVVEAKLIDDSATFISGYGDRAGVTTADVQITNGVVHIIDRVLTLPGTVSDTALAGGLTALVGALEATNLVSAVDYTPDITVFAPTNAAFEAIGSALGTLTVEQAASILEYHVINGTVAYSNLLSNTSVNALSGQALNITVTDGEVFVNSARVIAADILVANGVVHVIDGVLNPNGTATANPNASSATPAFAGASSGAVPYTSSVTATTTAANLASTTDAVAEGYTPASSGALASASSSIAEQASSTGGAAPLATAAIGMAALFGAAAYIVDL